MNSIIRKNTDQNNTIRRRRQLAEANAPRSEVDDYDSDEDDFPTWDSEEGTFPSPELLTQMSLNNLRSRQDELSREVVKAKQRATSALGFAALAMFALSFTILSVAVRGLFH